MSRAMALRDRRTASFAVLFSLGLLLNTGCLGTIRDTTTARTATEILLVSTAAERAVKEFDNGEKELSGKKVWIDDHLFESIDKAYALSAARNFVSEHGGILVGGATEKYVAVDGKEYERPAADRVLEIRNGTLGIKDSGSGFGIPAIPFAAPSMPVGATLGPLYLFYKSRQEGWAKFQFWIYDTKQKTYVAKSKDLWGHSYYNKWWIFAIGPFDSGNDIYPDVSVFDTVTK